MEIPRRQCSPNTRVVILTGLRNWTHDPKSPKVYWMNGMAGTEKTTIACSLCSELERSGLLGASFFCSRSLPDCQDVTRIVPTIAYQLACRSSHFRSALCRVLDGDPDLGTRHLMRQFEKLICEPLLDAKEAVPAGLTIVIDALDECANRNGAQLVLDALFQHAANLPVKFFVTCRPEPGILAKMQSRDNLSRSVLHLHDIERSLVQADIDTYLNHELAAILLPPSLISQLAQQSGSLFIYAATAVRYICPEGLSVDHHTRLTTMLGMTPSSGNKNHLEIDTLYTAILTAALEDTRLEDQESENIRLVLRTVVCAREPMTISALAALLKLKNEHAARSSLEPLRSLLHVSESSGLVSTFHASFPDYMLSGQRSRRFFCDLAEHSELLTRRCFDMMAGSLRFNICGLESSFDFDDEVPDLLDRIEASISFELLYACRYWGDHVERARISNEVQYLLEDFLSRQLLFWMEVLNLKQCISAGGPILSQAHTWLQVSV
jgi:hypothetical protein